MKKQNATWGAKRIPRRVLFFHCQNETFRDISSKNEIFTRQRGNNNVIISWSGISPARWRFWGALVLADFVLTSSLFLSKHQIAGLLFLL